MDGSLLRGLAVLLCCFRVLSGSFLNREYVAQAKYEQHLYVDKSQFFNSIRCSMCHFQFPGHRCARGRGTCIATSEEACTVVDVAESDGTPWLMFTGCMKNCANVNNIKWSIYLVNFRCCRGYDFCNEVL